MNKTLLILAISGCLAISQTSFAGGGQDKNQVTIKKEDITSVQVICGAGASGCQQIITAKGSNATAVMGAAGDKESYDTTGVPVTNLNRITKAETLALAVPDSGKKIFSLTPTTGAYANKAVKLLFVTLSLDDQIFPAGTPTKVIAEAKQKKTEDAKLHSVIKVYTQRAGETQWTESISYYTPETKNFGSLKVNVNPDGTFVVPDFFGANLTGNLSSAG